MKHDATNRVPPTPPWGQRPAIYRMIQPYALIRDKWQKKWQREKVEGLVVAGKYFWVMRRGSPATYSFNMRHKDLPNKYLYCTKRRVNITEEVPREDLFHLERIHLVSSIDSSVIPPEERVDRFRDKEDKYTHLPIPHPGSRGITVKEANISTLHCEDIPVEYNNKPYPGNFMQYDDVFPTPSSLTFGFHDVDPWHQSGNFPVGRANMKMTPNPSIHHMYHLDFFMKLYFMDYIKAVVIPETKKRLNSDMNLGEYFCVIGCRLIMACYVVHSVRDFFLKYTINLHKGAPI